MQLFSFPAKMIEKRRRDRINNSLNELRRLVPAAFEKQGSAKLEKAEILQMTVDHLTMLHAKGKQTTRRAFSPPRNLPAAAQHRNRERNQQHAPCHRSM